MIAARFFAIMIFLIVSFTSFSQDENKVFEKIEINAHPVKADWKNYIQRSSILPDSVKEKIPEGSYSVKVKFIVNKDGYIGDVKALNDPGFELASIAEKIISNYKGDWIPANQCGRSVKSYQQETIVFVVR